MEPIPILQLPSTPAPAAPKPEPPASGPAPVAPDVGSVGPPVAGATPSTDPLLESWTVPLAQVDAEGSPFRFRRELRPDASIKALAASIESEGLLHPLVVRKVGGAFQLVGGFRRHAALTYLAKTRGSDPTSVPVKVSVLPDGTTDDEALAVSFAENLARKSMTAEDKAIAAVKLRDEFGKSQEQIASMLKMTRQQLGKLTSLLTAPEDVREAFRQGRFGLKQVVALAKVADRDARALLIQRASVKQLRSRAIAGVPTASAAAATPVPPEAEVPASIRAFVRVAPSKDPTRPIQVTVKLASEDVKSKLLKYLARVAV